MHDAKFVSTPIASHFKLSALQCPTSDDDIEYMSRVPYSSDVGSLMYSMVCHYKKTPHIAMHTLHRSKYVLQFLFLRYR